MTMDLYVPDQEFEGSLVDQSGPYGHVDELLRFASRVSSEGKSRRPRVADVRCGGGRIAFAFASSGWDCYGFDSSTYFAMAWSGHPSATSVDVTFQVAELTDTFFLMAVQVDLILAFDDAAIELLDDDVRDRFFRGALDTLDNNGYLVFQIERSTVSHHSLILAELRGVGFRKSWCASPVALSTLMSEDRVYAGSRDTFVAHR